MKRQLTQCTTDTQFRSHTVTNISKMLFCLIPCLFVFLIRQVLVGYWQKCVEKMEEAILCASSGKNKQCFAGISFTSCNAFVSRGSLVYRSRAEINS